MIGKLIRIGRSIGYKTGTVYAYHYALSLLAAFMYGFPSRKMIVIGVTGTNGKSTTVAMIAHVLTKAGHKVGATSTAQFQIGDKIWLNDQKMTMVGRFQLQKLLHDMANAGCRYAVIETSSEGLKQFRHVGIAYDAAAFTNLTPEHIESHGSFDNYKKAKGVLFRALENRSPKKTFDPIAGEIRSIPRLLVANVDSEHAEYYSGFGADQKILFTLGGDNELAAKANFGARDVVSNGDGSTFAIDGISFSLPMPGAFNAYNAVAATAVCFGLGLSLEKIAAALASFSHMPGRMEFIAKEPIAVMVDYAPEPYSLEKLYESLNLFSYQRLIHVLGSAGGGRDKSRRAVLGRMAAAKADVVIVANEDPYDEDPQAIIDQVANAAAANGKKDGETLFRFLDRREALRFAYAQARPGDLIVSTGKGCEQSICVANGAKIPWDERDEWHAILNG